MRGKQQPLAKTRKMLTSIIYILFYFLAFITNMGIHKNMMKVFFSFCISGLFAISITQAASTTPAISSAEAKENIGAATILYQKNITKVAPENTAFYE